MTTKYEELINKLKIELKIKNIKFTKICSLINNNNFGEIIKIIDSESILSIIKNIIIEREIIGNYLENKLNNLIWLNECLIQFKEEPQLTKNKALKLLKSNVFINIYDLEAELYDKRTTKELLKKELRKKKERRFPLNTAKENITLKSFLINLL
jgi:hypothetical protein